MHITLTESAFTPNNYAVSYEVEEGVTFEPSQELLDCRTSSHSFNKLGVSKVVAIIQKDYEKALNIKEVKMQQAKDYATALEALYPMFSFEVEPNT